MFNLLKNFYKKAIKSKYYRFFDIYKGIAFAPQGDYWKDYFLNDRQGTLEELENLKKRLDKKSSDLVELVFNRFIYLVPRCGYLDNIYFYTKGIWTEDEIRERKKKLNINKLRRKYKIPRHKAENAIPAYSKQTFLYDYGLKFLQVDFIRKLRSKDIIDCGAYIGDTALIFAEYTDRKIYAFEPNTENYKVLEKTIKINGLENKISPVKAGLADQEEEIELYGELSAASVLKEHLPLHFNRVSSEKIKITKIDNFVRENKLTPGLIKMDIEGCELQAVQGALQTLREYRPILIVSVYHHPKDFFKIKPLIESLNLGYKFMFKKLEPDHFVNETVLIGFADGF